MRRSLFALAVACVLLLGACGGKSAGKAGEGTGAELAPADSLAFLSLDVERSNLQWRQAQELAVRIPVLQSFLERLDRLGVCLNGVQSQLGKTVDVAVLPAEQGLAGSFVFMTRPKNPAALERLLEHPCCESSKALCSVATTPPALALTTRERRGWLLVSTSEDALDRFTSEARRGTLAGSRDFDSAFSSLPKDALLRTYLNGKLVTNLLTSPLTGAFPELKLQRNPFKWIALSARPFEGGFRIEGSASGPEAQNAPNTLIEEAPAGSLLALGIGGSGYGLDRAVEASESSTWLTWAKIFLGLGPGELAALARGQIALYATRLGSPDGSKVAIDPTTGAVVNRPRLELVLRAPAAAAAVRRVEAKLVGLTAHLKGRVRPVTIAGARAEELTLGTLRLYFGGKRQKLFLSNDQAILARGPRLTERPIFAAAEKELSLPRENAGVLYLDLSGEGSAAPASSRSQAALLAYLDASKGGFRIEGVLVVG